jgi:Trk K+ transport system NAD-binding subunit
MKPRIIVCSLGRTGYQIFRLLKQQGAIVVGMSDRPVPQEGSDVVVGNLRSSSTLLAAGVKTAHALILAGNDEAINLAILMQARILNPQIRIINRLFNLNLGMRLNQTLPDHSTMSVSALAAPVFAFAALGNQAIGQLELFNQIWPIHEELIDGSHPWFGKSLRELWADPNRMLIYYLPFKDTIDLVSGVMADQQLQVGDRLIVALQPQTRPTQKDIKYRLLKLKRGLQKFKQYAKSALIVSLILFLTILGSALTYICVEPSHSFVDSLYFSVGMITGAGGNEQVVEHSPDGIKVFTVMMMLIGTGVVGISYALLNDFILGTRLKDYLDATRVPERNHYIICGLGELGLNIAQHLYQRGYEVVVIERDINSRFMSTAKGLKIPVFEGDASLANTLKSVNVEAAEALLAVTNDDTGNLEIALSARGLAPRLRVITRTHDSHFALMVQQVFDFEAVLNTTEIAAPAFAAAALGGRILGSGITADRLWVALGTLITPNHPFCGKRVQEVARKADFVPLYIETAYHTIHSWELLNFLLQPGDILYLTMPAHHIEQLWQSLPPERTSWEDNRVLSPEPSIGPGKN